MLSKVIFILALIIQTIMIPIVILYLLSFYDLMFGCAGLLIVGRAIAIIDSYVLLCSKGVVENKKCHYCIQVFGTVVGIIFSIFSIIIIYLTISLTKEIDIGFLLIVVMEELTFFICNVQSYNILNNLSSYTLLPQRNYSFVNSSRCRLVTFHPVFGMQYKEFPIPMIPMNNEVPINGI